MTYFSRHSSRMRILRILTSSSAAAERPRDALCPSVVSFNSVIARAQSLLLLLLMHQIYHCVQLDAVTLVHLSWPTYRVDELFAPPTLTASSSHSPTGPPLATGPFLLLVPRSGTVCHRRSHQRHHWTPFAGVWRLICSPCHIRTYNYRNWLTSVSGPCSKSLLRPL